MKILRISLEREPSVPPHDVNQTHTQIAYWEHCQLRNTAYLTTNGQIEISLCGLYGTVVAVLVTLGQGLLAKQNYVVFQLIIPGFSLLILVLSLKVYVWIREQLEYGAMAGLHPRYHQDFPSLEQWQSRCAEEWKLLSFQRRILLGIRYGTLSFVSLPFQLREIYRYYFLLYISVGVVSSIYGARGQALSPGHHETIRIPTLYWSDIVFKAVWLQPPIWFILCFIYFGATFTQTLRYELSRGTVCSEILQPGYPRMSLASSIKKVGQP
jgi:hypothetical protein